MQRHYDSMHAPGRRGCGGRKCSGSRSVRERLANEHFGDKPAWTAIKSQRFFVYGPGSAGFRIGQHQQQFSSSDIIMETEENAQKAYRSESITAEVFEPLSALEAQHVQNHSITLPAIVLAPTPSAWSVRGHFVSLFCVNLTTHAAFRSPLHSPKISKVSDGAYLHRNSGCREIRTELAQDRNAQQTNPHGLSVREIWHVPKSCVHLPIFCHEPRLAISPRQEAAARSPCTTIISRTSRSPRTRSRRARGEM
jgi:hypothetical protein